MFNRIILKYWQLILLLGSCLLFLPYQADLPLRDWPEVEHHDLVAETVLAAIILSWIWMAGRIQLVSSTFTVFYLGCASIFWLMQIKMHNEWVIGLTPMQAALELTFSLSGGVLITLGIYRAIQDHRALLNKYFAISQVDDLTGLYNRRSFNGKMQQFAEQPDSDQAGFSLVVLDLDHFKKINDEYGHWTGDRVLQRVAQIMRENVRRGDLVFRLGGEEFGILLPDCPEPQALSLLERIRAKIETHQFEEEAGSGEPFSVSASVGLAELQPGESEAQLYRRADAALYQAKANGRNCIALAVAS